MTVFCLERFNHDGDLVSRKCVIGSFKSSVERDHPDFVVSEIGEDDKLCEHCPVYPPASGLSEEDVRSLIKRFVEELLEEINKSKTT